MELRAFFDTSVIKLGLESGTKDDILKELDIVVCSVHYRYELPREKQTERLIRAMHNPYFVVLGHPLARHLGERGPCDIDMERIVQAAKETGTVLEVNAQPKRMDLDDAHARMARDARVMLAISTDSHSAGDLDDMRFGVAQARRGWVRPGDVLNTRSLPELRKLLRK
jgi:DNA polymerase (family X)